MPRHFIVKRTESNDWYDKAKKFLSDNECNPLVLQISSEVDAAAVFREALASLTAAVPDHNFTIDAEAGLLVVTADDIKKLLIPPNCACQCGLAATCGGGGGGGKAQ